MRWLNFDLYVLQSRGHGGGEKRRPGPLSLGDKGRGPKIKLKTSPGVALATVATSTPSTPVVATLQVILMRMIRTFRIVIMTATMMMMMMMLDGDFINSSNVSSNKDNSGVHNDTVKYLVSAHYHVSAHPPLLD